jgi:elongation factor P hydroxylase
MSAQPAPCGAAQAAATAAVSGAPARPRVADAAMLDALFARCFAAGERTRLVGGAPEPLYRPAGTPGDWHQLFYREDFAASALHEVAHWCIAGAERRRLPDYGYWYQPDGRGPQAQREFARVEARPQALEWVFSQSARLPFRLSLDNLDAPASEAETAAFAGAVLAQVGQLQRRGLPPRAAVFADSLRRTCGGPALHEMQFVLHALLRSA